MIISMASVCELKFVDRTIDRVYGLAHEEHV